MTEDMSFGDWSGVTPETMKTYSEEKLHLAMKLNGGGNYDRWAQAEMARRQSEKLGKLLSSLGELIVSLETATNKVHQGVAALALINEQSTIEVKRLVASSLTIERLTKWLVALTIVLAILTGLLCVDVGMKFTKEHFSEPAPPNGPKSQPATVKTLL